MRLKSSIVFLHAALLAVLLAASASAQTLRIGLAEDPDVLDPTLARTFVGRVVFAALCDKLFDIDDKLNIVPQLATGYEWSADSKALTIKLRPGVTFHDGEKFDAAAAKFNIERHKTLAGSNRRGELALVTSADVVDPMTVRLNLSAPFAPLLAQLADRAGMMVSPKAAQEAGDKFGVKPVCSGPFRFVERVAQDRIVLERYPNYWNKADIHLEKVIYLPIVDSTVRLANLQVGPARPHRAHGALRRPGAQDRQSLPDRQDHRDRLPGHHHQRRQERPGAEESAGQGCARARSLRTRARPRRHRAGGDGRRSGGRQPMGRARTTATTRRTCRFRSATSQGRRRCSPRPACRIPSFTLMTPTTSDAQKIAQVVQAMVKDAGFDVKIQSTEFATSLDMADKGQFEAYVLAWSGRADPDGNIFSFDACKQPLNYAGYCKPEVDEILNKSRTTRDPAERRKAYEQLAAIVLKDRPIVYLFHRHWLWASSAKLSGFKPIPDGLVRVQGLKLN